MWYVLVQVRYVCCDGGSQNRQVLKMHFADPLKEKYVMTNPTDGSKVAWIMDPKVGMTLILRFHWNDKSHK